MLLLQVSVVLKCKMSAFQAAIYDWVKSTGTLRLDPDDEAQRIAGNSKRLARAYAPLQNKCMELRKVCNHPYLNYPPRFHGQGDMSVRTCGKLWILDRILVKLHKTGHRVLLFSTMTRLLDILEDYLQWRRLIYRRIDGMTTLEARESAIVEFNRPNSDCFIFLLSIRAAGRGLNLQTADTVIVYDPDPNPKNEEQAVARAHRIGQKREVRVIYMEAVVESTPSYEKEDELRSGGSLDENDDELVLRTPKSLNSWSCCSLLFSQFVTQIWRFLSSRFSPVSLVIVFRFWPAGSFLLLLVLVKVLLMILVVYGSGW